MSETERMAELAHKRHIVVKPDSRACSEARLAIFNAALDHLDGAEDGLREAFEMYRGLPHEVRCEWVNRFNMHKHGLADAWHRICFIEKYQIDPEQLETLNAALEYWQRTYKLDTFGSWVSQLARFQLYSWAYYPDNPNGYVWKQAIGPGLLGVRPLKFAYTLTVDYEDDWAFWYSDTNNRGKDAFAYNPYRLRNSIPNVSTKGMGDIEKKRALLFDDLTESDWSPESGETREAAFKRIKTDFEKRLRTHLKFKAEQAKDAGYPYKRLEKLERDALWLIMKHVEGLNYESIERHLLDDEVEKHRDGGINPRDTVGADSIKVAVTRLEKIACLYT